MNLINIPERFVKVTEERFKQLLAEGPDYTRAGYIGSVRYHYRTRVSWIEGEMFAVVIEEGEREGIYVSPETFP